MASSLTIDSDVDPGPHEPSPGGAAPAAPPGSAESVQEPRRLPDICNLEWQREGMPDTEFNRKYPPDPWGEEAAPNARVWKVYRDHHTVSDRGMLDSWNKTLDVLLIFAGLFSAVSTAFLIESYKALQPDYSQYVAAFLYSAAVTHNRTGVALPALDLIVAPDLFVQTSPLQRWTNGLWFSSLVISLAVALLCILVKQWLDEYNSHNTPAAPSLIYWARRHRMYYRGLKRWGVPGLISFLPLLLHISLFLFFTGLVLFLLPLDRTIAYSLLVMVACILLFYVLSLVLPAWRVECPSYTPLFSQALLAVSRGISCLLYLGRLPRPLVSALLRRTYWKSRLYPVITALNSTAKRAAHRLKAIRTHTTRQLVREADLIAKWDMDLDGYALSALIDLPSDSTWGAVHTACAALGAITSTRTTDAFLNRLPSKLFHLRILDCFDVFDESGASTWSGFGVTSHAQLQRAYQVVAFHKSSPWYVRHFARPSPGLQSSLGIDGLLLQAIGVEDVQKRPFDIYDLLRSLQPLPLSTDCSDGFPLLSTCLLFLEYHSTILHFPPWPLSCFLLVFCAVRFKSIEMHDCVRALRSVETVLRRDCSITIPVHDRGDAHYVRAVVEGLWQMLADHERYGVDILTAQIVAHQACQCYRKASHNYTPAPSAQRLGLISFGLSPTFSQCVHNSDSLAGYIQLVRFPRIGRFTEAQMSEYWLYIATLSKLSWDYVPRSEEAALFLQAYNLFPVETFDWHGVEVFSNRGSSVTQDDWYEPVLSAFLDSPNALAAWTVNSLDRDDDCIRELATLAVRISIVLCRRQRLHRANDVFIRGFFAGSFLFARFRDLASRAHIPSERGETSFEQIGLNLATHCLRLSPERVVAICTQLEGTWDEGSELRERAAAFARNIRDGSAPGGALSAECSADCPCMLPGALVPPSRRARWDAFAARFRPGRNTSETSSNV